MSRMCYGGKELAASFRTVRNNTIKIAEEIAEDQYDFRPAPDVRSIGRTLAHIAVAPTFQYHVHSNRIDDLATVNFSEIMQKTAAEEGKTRTKADLIAFLRVEGERFAAFLEGVSDEFLAETVRMPAGADPAVKTRLEMLLSPKEHEMHHRGQLMTMQRMIGIVPHLTRERQARTAQAQPARG